MGLTETVKWCCTGFKSACAHAGKRGFGAFVDNSTDPVLFVLQHRALDPGAPMPDYDGHLSVITQTGMTHCPWCGKELMKWYKNDLSKLVRDDLIISLR